MSATTTRSNGAGAHTRQVDYLQLQWLHRQPSAQRAQLRVNAVLAA